MWVKSNKVNKPVLIRSFLVNCLTLSFLTVVMASATASMPPEKINHKTTMSVDEAAKELQILTQWEIDEAFVLNQATASINNQVIREKVLAMEQQSQDAIKDMNQLIYNHGREAPRYKRDLKGYVMQGYTAVRGLTSDIGVLSALYQNMLISNYNVEQVLKLNLCPDIKKKLQEIHKMKQRNLEELLALKQKKEED